MHTCYKFYPINFLNFPVIRVLPFPLVCKIFGSHIYYLSRIHFMKCIYLYLNIYYTYISYILYRNMAARRWTCNIFHKISNTTASTIILICFCARIIFSFALKSITNFRIIFILFSEFILL